MAQQLEEEKVALMAMQRDLYKVKNKRHVAHPSYGSSYGTQSTYSLSSFNGDEKTYKEIID